MKISKTATTFVLATLVTASAALNTRAVPQTSPNYRLEQSGLNSAGGSSSSSNYKSVSSFGEAAVGAGSGGSYKLTAGYVGQLDQSIELRLTSSGLQAYYPLDTNTGIVAYDATINNNNAVVSSASWATGKVSQGLSFNGIDNYVTIPNNSAFNQSGVNPLTVSAWVKSSGSSYSGLVDNKSGSGNNAGLSLYLEADGKASFTIANGSLRGTVTSTNSINDGNWHHVLGTRDSSGLRLYVDGVETRADNATWGSWNISTSQNIFLGGSGASTDLLAGSLDEIRLYNYSMNAVEVQNIYTANNAGVAEAITIPTVTPGASQFSNLTMTVSTDAGGYDSAISQNSDLTHTDAVTTIGQTATGTVSAPGLWDEGTTKGLGFTLIGGINIPAKWGTGPLSYKYAAIPSSTETFFSRTGQSGGLKESTVMQFKLDVPSSQKSGQYSNIVNIIVTAKP
jgi:Concanavalin A-like lectin/glucanases superfamily